jgi:nicotinate-nucleotide adenylyltransferase
MTPRLGILGGTFDPPHVGHLLAAWSAQEALGLDQVVLVPAAQQPLKAGREAAAAEHRLAMARLLVHGEPRLAVDAIEVERGGLSFTVDTMRAYRAARPGTELHLLLGEDAAALLGQWREPAALAALVRLVVLTRDGGAGDGAALPAGFQGQRLRSRRVDVSSTEIRARARAGLPLRGFVTDAVAAYIADHQLYRPTHVHS